MRRRREWTGPLLISPRSRRRLNADPAHDVTQVFANNPFFHRAFDADLHVELPPSLLAAAALLRDDDDRTDTVNADEEAGDEAEDGEDGEEDGEDGEDGEEEEEEEELFPIPPVDDGAALVAEHENSLAHSMHMVYEQFVRDLDTVSPLTLPPQPPPPPPPVPPVPPAPPQTPPPPVVPPLRVSPSDRGGLTHRRPGGDIVYVRLTRGDRQPRALVRLPNGGYSYPANPLFEVTDPTRRRSRRASRADAPIMLQRTPPPARPPPARPSAQGVHARLDRLRRQLFRRNTVGGDDRVAEASVPPHRILRNRNLPQLQVGRYVFPPPPSPPPPPPPPLEPFTVTEDMGPPPGRCSICLEAFKVADVLAFVPCQPPDQHAKDHVFHHACIREWARVCRDGVRTCPECRGQW